MGFLDKAKNAAIATKLKGEIVLLDRDMNLKKQKFGIEICDLLMAMERKQQFTGSSIFLSSQSPTYIPYGAAKQDIQAKQGQKDEIQQKLDAAADLKKQRSTTTEEKTSAMDKAKLAGTETKRRAKLVLLDREIKARKEQFGVEVYDAAVGILTATAPSSSTGTSINDTKNEGANSVKKAISKSGKMSFLEKQFANAVVSKVSDGLTQVTVSDQDIRACIEKIKTEIDAVEGKKNDKLQEIEQLK